MPGILRLAEVSWLSWLDKVSWLRRADVVEGCSACWADLVGMGLAGWAGLVGRIGCLNLAQWDGFWRTWQDLARFGEASGGTTG